VAYDPKAIKSVKRWSPNPAPVSQEELPDYLFNELNRLGDIIFNVDMLQLSQTNVAPGDEPRKSSGSNSPSVCRLTLESSGTTSCHI